MIRALSNALATIAPRWALSRAQARLQLSVAQRQLAALAVHEAAVKDRTTSNWTTANYSANTAIEGDYLTMLARSRAAMRDDWAAVAIRDAWVRHVVGKGFTCRSTAKDPASKTPLDDFNAAADAAWERWAATPAACDVERRKTFNSILALLVSEHVTAGQGFALTVYAPDGSSLPGLRLQVFEPEQMDWSKTQSGVNEVKGGIEVDRNGAAVAYWLHDGKHPLDGRYEQSRRFPADVVLHFFRQLRARQCMGLPMLTPVLGDLIHTRLYEQYTLIRAQGEACIGATLKRSEGDDGGAFFPSVSGVTAGTGKPTQVNFEPGMILDPGPGREYSPFIPQSPGSQFEPYTRQQLRKIAAGVGLDYPTVARDFTGANFGGQRQGLLETWKVVEPEQELLVDIVCRRVRRMFTELAIREGLLSAPHFYDSPAWREAYLSHDWQPQAKDWIDPANEAAAAKLELEQRLNSRTRILQARGIRREELDREIEAEKPAASALPAQTQPPAEPPPARNRIPQPRATSPLPTVPEVTTP